MTVIHSGIEVFLSDKRGRGVRAKQHIPPGTCLVKEEPFTCVSFKDERTKRCEYCLRRWDKMKACGGCKCVQYCSNECQIAAYSGHQYECRFKKKTKRNSLPDWSAALTLIRVICNNQKKKGKEKASSSKYPLSVEELCDGPKETNAELMKGAVRCLDEFVGKNGLPGWDHARLINLLSKLFVNAFVIYEEETRTPIGEGMYTRSAMFNHSCEPNCCFVYNGRKLEVRSIQDILPGEECCIHYVKLLQSSVSRRRELFKTYRFWCNCLKCQKQEEILSSMDSNELLKLKEAEVRANAYMSWIEDQFDGNYYQMLESCHEALEAMNSDLELAHPLMADLHVRAMEACIALLEWEEAIKHGMAIIEACKVHLQPTDPIVGFHMWRVARIQAVEMNQPVRARNMLQQAIEILCIGYGSSHPITVEAKALLGTIVDQ